MRRSVSKMAAQDYVLIFLSALHYLEEDNNFRINKKISLSRVAALPRLLTLFSVTVFQ